MRAVLSLIKSEGNDLHGQPGEVQRITGQVQGLLVSRYRVEHDRGNSS